jgi:hypothetical protein
MFTYYSHPSAHSIRVTVVGIVEDGILKIAAARCSKKDTFLKKTVIVPGRRAVTLLNGITIPAKKKKVIKGGYSIAKERLETNQLVATFEMPTCNARQFTLIAKGIALEAAYNAHFIEKSKV